MEKLFYWSTGVILLVMLVLITQMYRRIGRLKGQIKPSTAGGAVDETAYLNDEAIRYKLDPHLLKNALNAIQSHAYQSYNALEKLSNVLDFMLYESDQKWVKLKDEVSFARNLIEINRLKISPLFDLHVRIRVPSNVENLLVPPFISINPIENAFKHTDYQHDDSFISVVYEVREDRLVLLVSNKMASYTPGQPQTGGVGNKAFQSRLHSIYKENYRLEVEQKEEIYHVRLEIKLLQNDQVRNY